MTKFPKPFKIGTSKVRVSISEDYVSLYHDGSGPYGSFSLGFTSSKDIDKTIGNLLELKNYLQKIGHFKS